MKIISITWVRLPADRMVSIVTSLEYLNHFKFSFLSAKAVFDCLY